MAQQQNNQASTPKINPATDMPKKDFGADRNSDKSIRSPKRDGEYGKPTESKSAGPNPSKGNAKDKA